MAQFWSSGGTEPKRNYRWKVEITGLGAQSLLWWAKTVNVPSFDVSEVEHNHYDNKYYYPGRVSWTEVTLTLVDPISPDAVQETNKLLERSGYGADKKANVANKMTVSKRRGTSVGFKTMFIIAIDAEGNEIEKWKLNNPFIKSAKFGDLDYSNDELRTIEMAVRYDWATCEIIKGGEAGLPSNQRDASEHFVAGKDNSGPLP